MTEWLDYCFEGFEDGEVRYGPDTRKDVFPGAPVRLRVLAGTPAAIVAESLRHIAALIEEESIESGHVFEGHLFPPG